MSSGAVFPRGPALTTSRGSTPKPDCFHNFSQVYQYTCTQQKMSDAPVTLSAVEKMMEHMMDELAQKEDLQDLAKKRDIQDLKESIGEVRSSVGRVETRVDTMEARMAELQRRIECNEKMPPRMSTSSSRSAESESGAANEEWRPRLVHIRGWAPWGTGPEKNINRHDACQLQNSFGTRDIARRESCKWLRPFMQNHMITLEVQNGSLHRCKEVSDHVQQIVTKFNVQCGGAPLRSSAETSPS